MNNMSSQL